MLASEQCRSHTGVPAAQHLGKSSCKGSLSKRGLLFLFLALSSHVLLCHHDTHRHDNQQQGMKTAWKSHGFGNRADVVVAVDCGNPLERCVPVCSMCAVLTWCPSLLPLANTDRLLLGWHQCEYMPHCCSQFSCRKGRGCQWIQWGAEWKQVWKSLVPPKFWELPVIPRRVMNFCLCLSLLISGRYLDLQVAMKLPLSSLGQMHNLSCVLFLRLLGPYRLKSCLTLNKSITFDSNII